MIKRVLGRLSLPVGGLSTQAVRAQGTRTGFEWVTVDGQPARFCTRVQN
ncbi:MAG: hypothetical protein FJ009_21885 [Chloroflexi bacterium]|nr:hypothetical protein [Chloroflexota bacterium]